MSSNENAIETSSKENTNDVQSNELDKTCVVCFKIVDIFSVGECDHPVCYECSTRMRVLCKRNECPICRRANQRVIFTSEILPYRELEQKNRSGLYDKSYRISFTGQRAMNAFQRLLEHRCNKCTKGPFETAKVLKDHLRKEHELFFCDICVEHLNIFSFERRAYTREQLAYHRRKGDPDNTSHRGHPLCEYCDQRYLDRDELFRHLRRDHFFCHFCDADGANQFYDDSTSLREHFVEQHFLCEEGDCKNNIFSAVFRTDIDLKAHKASAHGQTSKHARTIDLQFNLAPRNRNSRQEDSTQNQSGYNEVNDEPRLAASAARIDTRNERDFPSLGNAPVTVRSVAAAPLSFATRSGLARTQENFPSLGGNDAAPRLPTASHSIPASAVLFKSSTTSKPNANTAKAKAAKSKPNPNSPSDFPALPGNFSAPIQRNFDANIVMSTNHIAKAKPTKSKPNNTNTTNDFPSLIGNSLSRNQRDLDDDLILTTPSFNMTAVPAKHRQLVPTYESVGSNSHQNQKLQTVQRVETKSQSVNNFIPKINSKEMFPSLGPTSSSAPPPQWLNAPKTKQPIQSKKSKVAPAPVLPSSSKTLTTNKENSLANSTTLLKSKEKKEKSKNVENNGKADKLTKAQTENKKNGKEIKTKDSEKKAEYSSNEKESKTEGKGKNGMRNGISSDDSQTYSTIIASAAAPPPGFTAKSNQNATRAPPGFERMIPLNQKQTFTYMAPSNALRRNQMLVSHFTKSLDSSAVDEFRNISKMFRDGTCNARAYYEHCESVLGEKFENIFPELLALLPDISKQQELLQVYMQKHTDSADNNIVNYIQVCDLCRQVVKLIDFSEHWEFHVEIEKDNKLNKIFPKLTRAKK